MDVQLDISAPDSLGVYHETVHIGGLVGNIPELHVQLEVVPRSPSWDIDPGMFDQSMNIIANWQVGEDASTRSEDVMDKISVWIGHEIRGVANITKNGMYYNAYITVNGHSSEPDSLPLEFRIWDADNGIEYDGTPGQDLVFLADEVRGTTSNPVVLKVDPSKDRARYIPS